jgi:sRNA-binding carbon storage regulator CsrA
MTENEVQKVFFNRVKIGESISIGDDVRVELTEIDGYETRLTITAPLGVEVKSDYCIDCESVGDQGKFTNVITINPEGTSVFVGGIKCRVKRVHGKCVDFRVTAPEGVKITKGPVFN